MSGKDGGTEMPDEEEAKRTPSKVQTNKMTIADVGPSVDKSSMIGVWIVIMSVVIDILGVSIVSPILPFYAKDFGANAAEIGYLYSAFTIMSLISTYCMGLLSDYIGRRRCILISLMGSLTGFVVMALVTNYGQLLAARFYGGATSGSFTIAQAYIADAVPGPLRGKYFSYLGGSLVLTFMVGPLLGGALVAISGNDYTVPYMVAASIAGIGFTFAFFKLHDVVPEEEPEQHEAVRLLAKEAEEDSPEEAKKADDGESSSVPCVVYLIGFIGFLNGTGFSVWISLGTLFFMEKFDMTPLDIGVLLMGCSFVMSIMIMFGSSNLQKRFGLYETAAIGSALQAVGALLLAILGDSKLAQWLSFVSLACCFFAGNGLFNPTFPTINAQFANKQNRGQVLAVGNTIKESVGVVAPIIFGILYDVDRTLPFYCASGVIICAVIPLMWLQFHPTEKEKKQAQLERAEMDLSKIGWNNAPYWSNKYGDQKIDVNDAAYIRLGKDVSEILKKHNHPWVYPHAYPQIMSLLDSMIFTVPLEVLAGQDKELVKQYFEKITVHISDLRKEVETWDHEIEEEYHMHMHPTSGLHTNI